MPRDSRLYMTFPNDFWTHHKVAPLSDAAFRAFVEMNGYSRMNDLDGVIPARFADFRWGAALGELVDSDPSRPLIFRDADTYVIRDYAEHQQTTAQREKVRDDKSRAGAIGAAKRWHGKEIADAIAADSQSPESRVQSSKTTYVSQSSYVPERETPVDNTSRGILHSYGLDPDGLRTLIHQHTQRAVTPAGAMRVSMWLVEKGRNVKKPGAYVMRCVAQSPLEVQQYIDEEGIA